MENFNDFEEKVNLSIDLLELAKTYCEINGDKSAEISTISTALDIVLRKQKELVRELDYLFLRLKKSGSI